MTVFRTYEIFQCMKRHWTTASYDFVKYKGKAKNLNQLTLAKSKERWFYEALNSKFQNEEQLVLYLIPIFYETPNSTYTDFLSEDSKELANQWYTKIRTMKRIFREDNTTIFSAILKGGISFEYFFSSGMIQELLVTRKIEPETFIILDRMFFFLDKCKTDDNIIFTMIFKDKLKKYSSFISIDLREYKKVLESVILEIKKDIHIEKTLLTN